MNFFIVGVCLLLNLNVWNLEWNVKVYFFWFIELKGKKILIFSWGRWINIWNFIGYICYNYYENLRCVRFLFEKENVIYVF